MQSPGELIGVGRVADVHAFGDHALKLYRSPQAKASAFTEAAILAIVEGHGLPAPHVHGAGLYGGRWGLVMDRIAGPTLGDLARDDPARLAECLEEMVRLHILVHASVEARLRSIKARLAANISRAAQLDGALKSRLLAGLATLPDGDRLCHGDFHPLNIIGEPGHTTIIDWLDAAVGHPAADVCRSFVLMSTVMPAAAMSYVDRYAELSGTTTTEIFRWLPYVAAARLTEGIASEEARLIEMASAG
jgi:aminoglycoside phosphotransferase